MNSKLIKVFSVVLLLSFLLTLLAACGDEPENSEDKETYAELLEQPFTVTLGSVPFEVTHRNGIPKGDEIVLYDYRYEKDGKPCVQIRAEEGRSVISLRSELVNGVLRYSIFELGDEVGKFYPITRNGFTLSVPTALLTDLRVRVGQLVVLKDFSDQAGELENHDLGSFYPSGDYLSALSRRLNMKDPIGEISREGIYFLSAEYCSVGHIIPSSSMVYVLDERKSGRFTIKSGVEANKTLLDVPQLVIVGEYNKAFAEAFYKEGVDLNMNRFEQVSSYSDIQALVFNGSVFEIEDEKKNVGSITSDGIYLFDTNEKSLLSATAAIARKDVVLINNTVVYVGGENERVMLPTAGGVVVSFAGEKKSIADRLVLGDYVETVQIETKQIEGMFVRLGKSVFSVDIVNRTRVPEGVSVVYTPEFGSTTGTNAYGTEIAVSGGKIVAIETGKGNIAIPEDGFVLSLHKDAPGVSSVSALSVGDDGVSFLSGNNYGLHTLSVTGTDTVRGENALIVYRNGSRTGTNVYGYEVLVDQNGLAIDSSYSGNSVIPKGGFVLSGHGINKDALEAAYVYGAKVLYDPQNKKVSILSSPDTMIVSAAHRIEVMEEELETAEKKLLDIDYDTLETMIAGLKKDFDTAKDSLLTDDCAKALLLMDRVSAAIEQVRYGMIESKSVENRSVWYRSTEKNDEQVRATVEKLKKLNVNSLYLETWYNGRFTGFSENPLIKHTSGANGEYDVLEGFVRICHENGIEVHAWVENFFIGTVEAQEQANLELANHFEGRWLTDRKGKNTFYYGPSNTNFIFMNPFDPEVRAFLIDFYKEIAEKYHVDGIHLDYIRFPELNYGSDDFGYNEDIVTAWQMAEKTTVDPATLRAGEQYESWIRFRQEIISSFVGEVHQMLLENDPEIWLSAAVYPGLPGIKNEIFQDCRIWVERGYMDELFSMSYGADNEYVAGNAAMFAELTGESCFYSTGISAFGETDAFAFAKQMTIVTEAGADGVAIFSLGNITPSNYQHQITEGAFRGPSVQANALNKTVAAAVRDYLRKAETVYTRFAGLSEENLEVLRDLLIPVLDKAEEFDEEETATLSEKKAYLDETLSELAALTETVRSFYDEEKAETATAELDRLQTILRTSIARLSERE